MFAGRGAAITAVPATAMSTVPSQAHEEEEAMSDPAKSPADLRREIVSIKMQMVKICAPGDCEHQFHPLTFRAIEIALRLADQVERLTRENAKARESLLDMVHQFAYASRGPQISTMGLSALEEAFDVLGLENPHPTPERKCDEPGCLEHATCGWPQKDGPYRRTCGEHCP